jgi:hypothetical protein
MLEQPHTVAGPGGPLEVSIHKLGHNARMELAAVLPDAPHSQGILATSTFQFAADGLQRMGDADAVPAYARLLCKGLEGSSA